MYARMRWVLGNLVAVTLLVLLVTGCETPVNTEYKPGTNFSHYRTFAFMSAPQLTAADDPGAGLRLAGPAKEAVISGLTAKGLAQAPSEQADLSVDIRGQSLPRVDVHDYGFTYPVMTRYGAVTVVQNPYVSVSSYNERTLAIELLDNHAKEAVWVGWMKTETTGAATAEGMQKAIHKILEHFPPPPAETSSNSK